MGGLHDFLVFGLLHFQFFWTWFSSQGTRPWVAPLGGCLQSSPPLPLGFPKEDAPDRDSGTSSYRNPSPPAPGWPNSAGQASRCKPLVLESPLAPPPHSMGITAEPSCQLRLQFHQLRQQPFDHHRCGNTQGHGNASGSQRQPTTHRHLPANPSPAASNPRACLPANTHTHPR